MCRRTAVVARSVYGLGPGDRYGAAGMQPVVERGAVSILADAED